MRDQDVRALFADLGADQGPVLRLSSEAVMRRGHRVRRRRRRLAVAGSSVVAAAVVGLAVVSFARWNSAPLEPAVPSPTTSRSVAPDSRPSISSVPDRMPDRDATGARSPTGASAGGLGDRTGSGG